LIWVDSVKLHCGKYGHRTFPFLAYNGAGTAAPNISKHLPDVSVSCSVMYLDVSQFVVDLMPSKCPNLTYAIKKGNCAVNRT
jgi:hypothetical protein